jgi:hypothetical protein
MGVAEMNLVDGDSRGYCWSRYSGEERSVWSGVSVRYKKS